MKKGYRRILLFSIILIIFLCINTFIINILSNYRMIFFLFMLLVVFSYYFVLEKDKDRYFKDILFELFVFIMTFFIIFYVLGIIVGLTKIPNYFTLRGIKDVLLPIILFCILRELLRYNMLNKADGSKICTVLVVVLFILLDIGDDYYYFSFANNHAILKFVALLLLPGIAKNISYTFISKRYGYKPVIIFDLIISLYQYVLPIVPNPNEYVTAIIYLLVPVLFAFRIYRFFLRRKDEVVRSNYNKKRFTGILVPTLITMTMVYFYSGYFRFYAIAIASGSMETQIHVGDVVVADQHYDYESLVEGDVIAYRYEKIIVVQRIVKKVEIGDLYVYYTKGDANNHVDDFVIEEDTYIGKIRYKVPYIGYPTVWFNKD